MKASTIPTALLLWASSAAAAGTFCSWPLIRNIKSVTPTWTTPELVAGVFVGPSSTTGTIAAGYTFMESSTITGGISGSSGLLGIINLGVTASYGTTTARGTSLTVGITCPANVRCGLTASTYVLEIKGTETMYRCGSDNKYDPSYPCSDSAPKHCPTTFWNTTSGVSHEFTAYAPLAKSPSNVDQLLAVEYNACSAGMDYPGMKRCPGY
ncbi:hypothetical protein DM02DRAFT_89879 [Periconia macrospinosa]|uniref:Uncharacterized protein n=1 Tax=Periconia macrospinosa TaxID=97972 RepID=A0A2V1DGN4_9PLEO|nr:hypothetical protein DM02DRAFT_89879 [Periconia macrospinosa]